MSEEVRTYLHYLGEWLGISQMYPMRDGSPQSRLELAQRIVREDRIEDTFGAALRIALGREPTLPETLDYLVAINCSEGFDGYIKEILGI